MNQHYPHNPDHPFQVGEWRVDPNSGRLQRKGEEVKLEPKVMEVLQHLARQPGKVISREELEANVWTGMIVGYDAVTATVIKLRKSLGDNSRNPKYIETVSKKGYRLIAEVSDDIKDGEKTNGEIEQEKTETSESGNSGFTRTRDRTVRTQLIAAITGLFVILAGWKILDTEPDLGTQSDSVKNIADGSFTSTISNNVPSVVVLPFKNLSNDPQQEYFSDGITDDIITDLSKVGSLRVVARQSAYYFKDSQVSLEDIASDLGVKYIIEGSVQKAGQRIRVNIQLTDAGKGHHIWAERFDRKLNDIFSIQDEITKHIIDAMFVTLSEQESASVNYRTTNSFEAYDAFLRGLQLSGNRNKENYNLTMDAFRRAIELDPKYARAYGAMAVTLTRGYRFQWTDLSMEEAQERALQLAKTAVELDQSTPQIYWAMGFVRLFRNEYQHAEEAAAQSVKLSPNYADGYGLLAFIYNWRGKADKAELYIKKAMDLNPYHTYDYPWNLGLAYYTMGKYENAITYLSKSLDHNETVLLPRLVLAASYIRLGQLENAQWEIEQVDVHRPGTTISHLTVTLPFEHPEQKDALLNDLREAGLTE